jgi:hypothetical protein
MRASMGCTALLGVAIVAPAGGLTLYKCVLRDGSGIVYQQHKPTETECAVEIKRLDPDANVIPASDFIGGEKPAPVAADAAVDPPSAPLAEEGASHPESAEP